MTPAGYLGALGLGAIGLGAAIVLGRLEPRIEDTVAASRAADGSQQLHPDRALGALTGRADAVWMPFLMTAFWTAGIAVFGVAGVALRVAAVAEPAAAGIAAAIGLLGGYAVARGLLSLHHEERAHHVRLQDFVGDQAVVLLHVRPHQPGKIVVDDVIDRIELVAHSDDGLEHEHGARVQVVSVAAGIARVRALPPEGTA